MIIGNICRRCKKLDASDSALEMKRILENCSELGGIIIALILMRIKNQLKYIKFNFYLGQWFFLFKHCNYYKQENVVFKILFNKMMEVSPIG